MANQLEPLDHFWLNVNLPPGGEWGCWEWTGYRTTAGYGEFSVGGKTTGRKKFGAHRFSYAYFHGPIPAGLCVLHSCDHPWCVNPAHLRAGTRADNAADAFARGRRGAGVPKFTDAAHVKVARQLREWRAKNGARTGQFGRPQSAVCGTRGGFFRHRKNGEVSCEECRQAENAYQREWYQRRKRKAQPTEG